MSKYLIAYFSRRGSNIVDGRIADLKVGNTEKLAGMIKKLTGADLFEIKAAKPYPADYRQTTEQATAERAANLRPSLASRLASDEEYDKLFLGYPNWCGTMPMPVFTFMEEHGWAGKIILPFCTNEGSGLGSSEDDLKKLCPYATVADGFEVLGHLVDQAEADVVKWLTANGIEIIK